MLEGTCQTECQKNVFKTACFLRFSVTLFCSNFHSLQALETCLEACFEACSDAFILATLEFETCIEACLQLRSKIQQGSFQLRQVQLCCDSWLFFLGPAPFAFCFASLLNGDAYLAGGSAFRLLSVFVFCSVFDLRCQCRFYFKTATCKNRAVERDRPYQRKKRSLLFCMFGILKAYGQ